MRNFEIAQEKGFLRVPAGTVVDRKDFAKLRPSKRLVVCTGSQGEPMSALSRISMGEHPFLRATENDLVMISARMIPGNERSIYRMINHLYRRGTRVVTSRDVQIHCSGH